MRKLLLLGALAALTLTAGCNRNKKNMVQHSSEATEASETGATPPLEADVLLVTHPLINGQLYNSPSFEGVSLIHFDTAQQIQVLDTSNAIFIKARIRKDTIAYTGYVSKAILPEK
ncbi:hypothetical protein [Pontibacter liquoris]|uniref:hypothetical protein n=1 Tax=Pontibacter liquoris TaxID=2905677 RepID=UPI001FA7CBFA|nr:hypothetical protein [Pontibacter liquoris]